MEKKSSNNISQKSSSLRKKIFVTLFVLILSGLDAFFIKGKYLATEQVGEKYLKSFIQNTKTDYIIFGINFLIIFFIFLITNFIIKQGLRSFFSEEKKELPKLPNKSIAFVIAIITSFIAKWFFSEKYKLLANVNWFGINDPIFNNDISYYMFILPFIRSVIFYFMMVYIFKIVYIAFYNVITLNTYLDGIERESLKKSGFVKHIIFNSLIVVFLFAGYVWVNSENILTQNLITIGDSVKTQLIGAGSSDITVKYWGYRILCVIIICVAIRLVFCIKKSDFKQGAISILVIPTYLIGLFFVLVYLDYIYMGSNVFDKQKTYIGYNINFTKEAFGIDLDQVDISNYDTITKNQVDENKEFIDNIPLFTGDLIEKSLNLNQEDSMYYKYSNSRLAYYNINGKKQLVYLTPREIITNDRSYNNLTYEYTHGYSVILSSVSKLDKNNHPEILYKDIKSNSFVSEPRIYFGLQNDSEIIVDSDYGKEYDYLISASQNNQNVYDGYAGTNLDFGDRLILGLRKGNPKLAFSKYINENSKIITDRNVLERVKEVLPNLMYDTPYLVVSNNGKLIWIVDGYTYSKEYPYSQFTTCANGEKINYIRNSVKVLVDAYNGTTKFYITDKDDPIINAYNKIYPDVFENIDTKIPEDIASKFTYPKLLFKVQSEMINLYHGISEDVLYRGDNVWQISSKSTKEKNKISPYFTLVKNTETNEPELGLMITYNKYGKQSMTAYLVGTSNGENNKLTLYKFDSTSSVAGISQVNNQIEQDETISKELEELNTTGTNLIKDMQVIPLENTLLYVEKVYQVMLNDSESVPKLKKVIVASGNLLAMGNDLEEAISNLYSDHSVELDFFDSEDMDALIDSIIKANSNLKQSMDANDFEMIGKDLDTLEGLIEQLEILQEKNKKDSNEDNEFKTEKIENQINDAQNMIKSNSRYIKNNVVNEIK